ncbi:MAG TPA: hypothetical protein VHO24_12255, partial [Opitutaceae bacterium]|nr:hypothetical protein [Opitutaceae bacterium]
SPATNGHPNLTIFDTGFLDDDFVAPSGGSPGNSASSPIQTPGSDSGSPQDPVFIPADYSGAFNGAVNLLLSTNRPPLTNFGSTSTTPTNTATTSTPTSTNVGPNNPATIGAGSVGAEIPLGGAILTLARYIAANAAEGASVAGGGMTIADAVTKALVAGGGFAAEGTIRMAPVVVTAGAVSGVAVSIFPMTITGGHYPGNFNPYGSGGVLGGSYAPPMPTRVDSQSTPTSNPRDFIKLKGTQGYRDFDGNFWKKDQLHKDHWDVSDRRGNKIKEVDFNGEQIWPDGPKNKNK